MTLGTPEDGARRAAIVLVDYFFGVSAGVVAMARRLAAEGYAVDVFVDPHRESEAPSAELSSHGVNVIVPQHVVGRQNDHRGLHSRLKAASPAWILDVLRQMRTCLSPIVQVSHLITHRMHRLLHPRYSCEDYFRDYGASWAPSMDALRQRLATTDYDFMVAVEPLSLVATFAALATEHGLSANVVYYNLELMQYEPWMPLRLRLLKQCEIECSRACTLVVTPDGARGRVLLAANGLDPRRLRYLRVSVDGQPVREHGRYFRDAFGLTDDVVVVLYAGNLRAWAMCAEIVTAVASWPARYVLIMHDWRRETEDKDYVRELRRLAPSGRVFFSSTPIPDSEFPQALSSADIAIALYRALDANFTETGSSSNKLAQYARAGLPVVASDFPSIRRVLERCNSGITVERPEDIAGALDSIMSSYDAFKQGALRSFEEHYSFDHAFEPLLSDLRRLRAHRSGTRP